MVKLLVSQSLVEVETLKNRLKQAGIPCLIKNQYTATLAGMVPFTDVFPELWVIRDQDGPKAQELLESWKQDIGSTGPDWTCLNCGERHGQQFTSCWKCGANRDQPQIGEQLPSDDSNGGQEKLFPWSPLLTGLVFGVAVITILGLFLTPLFIRQWPVLNQTEKQDIKFLLGLFLFLVIVAGAIDLIYGKHRDTD